MTSRATSAGLYQRVIEIKYALVLLFHHLGTSTYIQFWYPYLLSFLELNGI